MKRRFFQLLAAIFLLTLSAGELSNRLGPYGQVAGIDAMPAAAFAPKKTENRFMKIPILLAAALLASPLVARAELTVKALEAKPAGVALLEVEHQRDRAGNWRWFRTGNAEAETRRDVGQIFVAPGGSGMVSLGSILLQVSENIPVGEPVGVGSYGAAIVLKIYEYPSLDELRKESPLVEEKGTLPDRFSPDDFLLFQFSPVSLQAGKTYAFLLSYEKPSGRSFMNLCTAPARAYPKGRGLFYGSKPDAEGSPTFYEMSGNLSFSLLAP